MPKQDIVNALVVSFLIGVFLLPVIKATGFWDKFPQILMILVVVAIPILGIGGMIIAYQIGKRLAILWQFSKFAEVGVLNTAIDFGILNLMIAVTGITSGPGIIPLNALALSCAVVNSYFWNRRWVFGSAKQGNFVVFFIVTIIGIAINSGIVFLVTTFVPKIWAIDNTLWANFAKVMATGISLFWNFAGYRLLVFKK